MARPKKIIDMDLCMKAKIAKKEIPDNAICSRLQAIISSGRHPITLVASVMGVSRGTLWRWITKFRAYGIEGLYDRAKGHRQSKLDEKQKDIIFRWINEDIDSKGRTVYWTLDKLILEIKESFGINVGKTPLWRTLRLMGFKQKVPRPVHVKADPVAQEEFKKKRQKQ